MKNKIHNPSYFKTFISNIKTNRLFKNKHKEESKHHPGSLLWKMWADLKEKIHHEQDISLGTATTQSPFCSSLVAVALLADWDTDNSIIKLYFWKSGPQKSFPVCHKLMGTYFTASCWLVPLHPEGDCMVAWRGDLALRLNFYVASLYVVDNLSFNRMQYIIEDGLNRGQIKTLTTTDRSHWSSTKVPLHWDHILSKNKCPRKPSKFCCMLSFSFFFIFPLEESKHRWR